jgi:flagellar biogenesis protein FliO
MFRRLFVLLLLVALAGGADAPPISVPVTQPFMSDSDWNHSAAVQPADAGAKTATPGKAMLQTMAALAVVLALAVGGALFVKKFGVRRIMPNKGTYLEVVESVAVGFKRSVLVLRINDQIIVVGQGEHELNQLGMFPASTLTPLAKTPSAPAQVIDVAAPPAPANIADQGFRAKLNAMLGKRA